MPGGGRHGIVLEFLSFYKADRKNVTGGLRVRLPPLRDHSWIKTHGAADEPTRDHVRLRLAVNRDWMEMENPGDLASSECPMIGAEDLRDQRWV
jgi:hypothetical protein